MNKKRVSKSYHEEKLEHHKNKILELSENCNEKRIEYHKMRIEYHENKILELEKLKQRKQLGI